MKPPQAVSVLPAKRSPCWRCGAHSCAGWLILSRNWDPGSPWCLPWEGRALNMLRQENGKHPWGLPPVSGPEGRLGTSYPGAPPCAPCPVAPEWSLFVKASQLWDPFRPLGDSWDRNTGFELTMRLVTTTTAQAKKTKTKQHKQDRTKDIALGEKASGEGEQGGERKSIPPKRNL